MANNGDNVLLMSLVGDVANYRHPQLKENWLKFMQIYNHIDTRPIHWTCDYDESKNADDALIMYYAEKYATYTELSKEIKVCLKSDAPRASLFQEKNSGFVEYILIVSEKKAGRRAIVIMRTRQWQVNSILGWLLTIGASVGIGLLTNPIVGALAFIGKIAIDLGVERVDVAQTYAIKYLESRNLIQLNDDKTGFSVRL